MSHLALSPRTAVSPADFTYEPPGPDDDLGGGSVRLIHDREVEAVHLLSVEPLPARQSGLQRPANLQLTDGPSGSSRSTREAYVARTMTGPWPAHRASRIGFVVVRTPSCSRISSFSSEHTATIGAR